jgi:hypothetical protein
MALYCFALLENGEQYQRFQLIAIMTASLTLAAIKTNKKQNKLQGLTIRED